MLSQKLEKVTQAKIKGIPMDCKLKRSSPEKNRDKLKKSVTKILSKKKQQEDVTTLSKKIGKQKGWLLSSQKTSLVL